MSMMLKKKCCCKKCGSTKCPGVGDCCPTGPTPSVFQVTITGVVIDPGCYYCDGDEAFEIAGTFPDRVFLLEQTVANPCRWEYIEDSYSQVTITQYNASSVCEGDVAFVTNRLKIMGYFGVDGGFIVEAGLRYFDGVIENEVAGGNVIAYAFQNLPASPPAPVVGNVCCDRLSLSTPPYEFPTRCGRFSTTNAIVNPSSDMGHIAIKACADEEEEI